MYAQGHFEGDFEADILTLNPYMGHDAVSPYAKYIEEKNKGAFILGKTSNEGSRDFQDLSVGERKLYGAVLDKIESWNKALRGYEGFGGYGAVVGVNHASDLRALCALTQNLFLLIPGYGAQGAKIEDIAMLIREHKNGVVNVSRVCLRVSKRDYEIIDLLNYDELSRKWNDIKSEIDRNDALRQIKTEELQQIIEAGDTEYLTDKQIVLDEMRRLFVYRTFFGGFRQFADEVASIEYTLHSNIAPETEVPLKLALTKEVRNEDDHFLCYTIDGKNLRFNDREIKKIFRTQFKVLKESYDDYEHNYFSVVEIDTATHWLTSINCSTKEIVNDGSLTAEIICDIEDITEKEHTTEKEEEEQL